jgi:hypothetical protein
MAPVRCLSSETRLIRYILLRTDSALPALRGLRSPATPGDATIIPRNMTPTQAPSPSAALLPECWRPFVEARLGDGEKPLAWLETDLDARLDFAEGIVVLTSRRLLAGTDDATEWQSLPYVRGCG